MILDIIIAILVYIFIYYKKMRDLKLKDMILYTLLYIYIIMVLKVTLMPIMPAIPYIFDHPYVPMRFDAYYDLTHHIIGAKVEVILNIIMTMPFGFLLSLIKKYPLWKIILYAFLFSLLIEIIQPLLHGSRTSDVTDLINNTLGGLIGYFIYVILKPLIKKLKL